MEKQSDRNLILDFIEHDSIDDQAAKWVAKLDFDKPEPGTVADFQQWVKKSPAHREAFKSYVDVWNQMNVFAELVPPTTQREAPICAFQFTSYWLPFSFVLVACLLFFHSLYSPQANVYITRIGEQHTFRLTDGSTALLNTDSEIEVKYTPERRLIHLIRGEVHFKVKRNTERPFEVLAGRGTIRAVGTAFTVYLREDDVEVLVTEGVVEVDSIVAAVRPDVPVTNTQVSAVARKIARPIDLPEKIEPSQVRAGNLVIYERYMPKQRLSVEQNIDKLEMGKITAWQKGLLVFEDETLESVMAEVSRYTKKNILIPEKHVRLIKVGGQFKVGDIDSIFEALKISFNIHAESVSDDLVYLVHGEF